MISVIIVNYKTFDMTCRTLEALLLSVDCPELEIILVDNGSGDGSGDRIAKQFSQIIFVPLSENIGFARANNAGIKIASGDTILLLNSDVTVTPTTLATTLKRLSSDFTIGCVGPKLMLPSGELDHACHRGIPTPWNSFCYFSGLSKYFPASSRFNGYRMSWLDTDNAHAIGAITGAYMLIKKEVIDTVGMFDESYFMYGEDLDLCVRIQNAGWSIFYEPAAHAVHHKGSSSKSRPYWLIFEFYRAMHLFHKTHIAKSQIWFINAITYIGISILCAIAYTKRFFKGKTT